jgi:hypothetical protein
LPYILATNDCIGLSAISTQLSIFLNYSTTQLLNFSLPPRLSLFRQPLIDPSTDFLYSYRLLPDFLLPFPRVPLVSSFPPVPLFFSLLHHNRSHNRVCLDRYGFLAVC